MDCQVVFEDKDILVFHVYSKLDNPTMLKVQKSLYFLWAYYAGTYGSIDKSNESDIKYNNYPKFLFNSNFKALKYGPVEMDTFIKQKEGFYTKQEHKKYICKSEEEKEIMSFIDDILNQINKINDFGLIGRAKEDKCWESAYKSSSHSMCNDSIKKEYMLN